MEEELLIALQDDSPDRRDEAFQQLLRTSLEPAGKLRAAMGIGSRFGHPVVALLYAQGRGDLVPLDLRARHLAGFEWPRFASGENAVVEPYVRGQVEQDLVRAGRSALRPLGQALEDAAPDEKAAMRMVRAILWIGGRAAGDELARLLEADRDLGGPRVCDAAAAALLYLGRQELALRLADPDARLEAARSWWELARDFPEDEWIRDAVETLVSRVRPKDPEGIRSVLELFTGRWVEDPRDWWEKNRGWTPEAAPLNPGALLPALSLGRARAYDANRRLEEASGARVYLPAFLRVGDLAAAFRLWQPPEDLELRWRRFLESPLLRLSVAAIGAGSPSDPERIKWAQEAYFRPTERESGELHLETRNESYSLFVQSADLGTRLVAIESHGTEGSWTGVLREFRAGRPMVMFSAPLRSALVAVVEEVSARRIQPPALELQTEWRTRLRSWADSTDALRALGYFQDSGDLQLLRQRRAGAPLLLLGDPEALELKPQLEPYEIEMALRLAHDPRVRNYLESLRRR